MDIFNKTTGEIRTEWVKIQYDKLPKYYKECKLQGHDQIECWHIHPELMDHNDKGKRAVQTVHGGEGAEQNGRKKTSNNRPIKILSSGKVVGNIGEQWKEVRDNRIKNDTKQTEDQRKTGRQILEVDRSGRETDASNKKLIQVANKYAALEMKESDLAENNQQLLKESTGEGLKENTTAAASISKGSIGEGLKETTAQ
ncbi:uncharacterized protein [Nicotiana tomentosiformis]|uniref:uncharacterized protein n=1 Tax=Nicotiana tomentosiformis TaxID=4098 RepID=UPI00388CBDE4